jgi:Zn-dependent M28 family amino/carboxypeptidase
VDCPPIPAQVTMAVEDYNRLVRMTQQGEQLKMAVDLQTQYHTDDLKAYNTIAEIPGSDPDLKDQLVMAGGHMDSWQSGTGATDNGVGVVAAMEAVRIIKALDLKPRRTIRIALWTGEEQGLLGSRAYVTKHFGSYPGGARGGGGGGRGRGRGAAQDAAAATQPAASRPARVLTKQDEYEKLACYFNLDNGTGKIRGVYTQGNEGALPLFRRWLAPFADLGASTLTTNNTGSTDHISFDSIGLPGFQFIQDPIEYFSRTHHSSADVYDRIQAEDLKQASTIMAAFLYQAAQMDERFPRKPEASPNR